MMDGTSPRTREVDKDRLIDQLRMDLQAERNKNKTLHEELRALREAQVQAQAATEQEEEMITNTLMKRMNELKKDRDRLAMQVEQEEEYLTNTLQKKLRELAKEKAELENRLEAEEEYIGNKLQRQLDDVLKEKTNLEQSVRTEREEVEKLRLHSAKLSEELAQKNATLERERQSVAEQHAKLAEQLETLKREKLQAEMRAQREHQLLNQATYDKAQLEIERERTDEREFNAQLVHKLELAAKAGGQSGTRSRSGSSAGMPLSPNLSAVHASSSHSPSPSPSTSQSRVPPVLKLNLAATAPLSPRLGISPRNSPHGMPVSLASPRSHPHMLASPHLTATALHTNVSSLPHTPHLGSPRVTRSGIAKSGKVLKQGWLRRRRPNDPHWTRQWCQLRDNEELWSWPDGATIVSDNPIDPPEAILNLDTVKTLKTLSDTHEGYKHVFFTLHADGTEWFAFDTKEQLDEWSSLLRDLCPCLTK